MSKVFLVGAGPGDPLLITLRGLELIRQADVIIYDYLVNRDLLVNARKDAELIYVGKQASQHELPQEGINELLVRKARSNGVVVRLKGGDPFIFGRGGEEAEVLVEAGVPFEIVPGVTSAISAPAYAGIPLTHRDYASSVAFVTGHEDENRQESTIRWDELAKGPDTLVFLMGVKNLKEIASRLVEGGRDAKTPVALVTWGTTARQQVVTGNLKNIDRIARKAGVKPPSIILVGNVVRLREKLQWFEKRPLFGKRVVVTRPPHQSARLGSLLSEKGAQVIYAPAIEIAPIEPNRALLSAIDSIASYTCIIFTSVNGVSVFFDALLFKGLDARALSGIKILPIGDATSALIRTYGIIPDFLPKEFTSEGIVEVLKTIDVVGHRFLMPRAEEARDVIVQYIKEQGGVCDVVPVYRAIKPVERADLTETPDIVTFTSSSTVTNFVDIYGRDILDKVLVASIGPVTTKTLARYGLTPQIEAKQYDIPGLVDAIETYLKPRNT